MYNQVQADVKMAKENQSARLQKIKQVYSGDKKAISAAEATPIKRDEIVQGVPDSEKRGNRATYLYNEILNGVGSIAAGLGDVGATVLAYAPQQGYSYNANNQVAPRTPEEIDEQRQILTDYRKNTAPSVRDFLTNTVGIETDEGLKSKYKNETFTAALGGLASSAPAIAATLASGGVGTGAMFLQSYDNALQSIDQTPEGQNLDDATKTYFATGVGIATAALEKFGLDRIFKAETGVIGNLIAKQALKKATAQTGGKVTGDVFTKFLDSEVVNLSNKYITAGIKGLDGALIEYGTEALQEGAQAGAELLLNEQTGEPVFDTSNTDDWIKFSSRMHKAGVMGAIGGGVLGGVAGIANLNRSKLEKTQESLDEVNAALDNENLSEASQKALIANKIELESELDAAAAEIDETFDSLDEEQQERVIDITDRKAEIIQVLEDPAVPEAIKEDLSKEDKVLDKELESINPVAPKPAPQTISDSLSKGVYTRNGQKGELKVDGQSVVFETNDTIYELGNVDEISDMDINELGIRKEQPFNIQINDDNSIEIDGKKFINEVGSEAINYNSNGDVVSVNVTNEKGDKRTIRGAKAEEIAYQYKLKETNENTIAELNDTIAQAEEIATQHEQMAELETDPVEKQEELDIAKDARRVVQESKQELKLLTPRKNNKQTIKESTNGKKIKFTRKDGTTVDFDVNDISINPEQELDFSNKGENSNKINIKYGDDILAEVILRSKGNDVRMAYVEIDTLNGRDGNLGQGLGTSIYKKIGKLLADKHNKKLVSSLPISEEHTESRNEMSDGVWKSLVKDGFATEKTSPQGDVYYEFKTKGGPTDAVQKQIATKVDVRKPSGDGQKVESRNTKEEKPAGEIKPKDVPVTPKEEKEVAKAGDPLRAFANKVREGKINKLGGFKAATGFDAAWDLGLEAVAISIEGGAKIADAIQSGLKAIKQTDWYKELPNKGDFDKQYNEHMNSEYEIESNKTKPIKNEETAATAKELGVKVEDTKKGVRTQEVVEAEATAEIKKGYDVPDLIDQILNDNHQATDTEVAILSKYLDAKETEIKDLNKDLRDNGATMSKSKFNTVTESRDAALEEFQEAAQASRKTGTISARALNARKFSLNKEYSLENMVTRKRTALGGDKLSKEQLADITQKFQQMEQLQKDYEARVKKLEIDNAALLAGQAVKKTASDRANRKAISKSDLRAERAKIFDDIRKGFKSIRQSGQAMSDIPYRRELAVIAKHTPSILRNLAKEGLVEVSDVINRIYDEFKSDIPELTKADVTDIIAGVYDEPKKTKDNLQKEINALRNQAKLINRINELEAGVAKAKPESNTAKTKNEQIKKLRDRIKELESESGISYDKDLQAFKNRIQKSIDDISKKLNDKDYAKKESAPALVLDAEALELRRERDRIKHEFDIEVAKDQLDQRTVIEKAQDDFLNIASLPRSLKASLDFSAVLRQGLFLTPHLKESNAALATMFDGTLSKEKYENWLLDLKHSPMYDLMKDSGLYISDNSNPKLLAKEEAFTSNLAGKLPLGVGKLVNASERAYTGYLNAIRTGVFTSEAQKLIRDGYTFENNPEEFKSLAKVINVLSGRGDIPDILGGRDARLLSNALFSPRFLAARIQTLYIWADPRLTKRARALAAKDIGQVLASAAVFLAMAIAAGYEVEDDPRSPQFLKIKNTQEKGNTYYDILGGLPRYVNFLTVQLTGEKKNSLGIVTDLTAGKYKQATRLTEAANFIRGKFAPAVGSAVNLMEGRNVIGEKYEVWPDVPLEFVPLPLSDVYESYQVGGISNALLTIVPSQFGITVSSYGPRSKKSDVPQLTPKQMREAAIKAAKKND